MACPPPPPPLEKKKKGDRTRAQQTNVAGAGLEDFVDWAGIIASEPAKEEEMSRLTAWFFTLMRKRPEGSEGESTPIYDRKHPKRSSPGEEAQKDWALILVDSPDPAFNDQPVLEEAPSEADAPLEEGIPARGAFQC